MGSYIVRRLLYGVLTFFGITLAVFILLHSVPGDPISFYISQHMTHLSRPALDSILDHRRVTDHIFEKLPNTIELNAIAFLLAAAIGVPIGLWSAARSGRPVERASAVLFFLLYSLPSFWVALLLMEFFSVKLGILPT